MTFNARKLPWLKASLLSLVAVLVIAVLVFLGINILRNQEDASASFSQTDCVKLEMQPASTCTFLLTYTNGEGSQTTDSRLTILVGSELEIDTTSFTDEMFVNGVSQGVFPMNIPNLLQSNTQGWGARIQYLPGSANTVGTPSGTPTPGTLPAFTTGRILFRATLKNDVLERYQVGDILEPPTPLNFNQQGIYSVLNTNETPNPVPGIVKIKIIAPDVILSSETVILSQQSSVTSSVEYQTTGVITGPISGTPGGQIQIGPSVADGPATYTNSGACVIAGNISNSVFTPSQSAIIDPTCPVGLNSNGNIVLQDASVIPNVNSNFTDSSSNSSSSSSVSESSSSTSSAIVPGENCGDKFGVKCRLYFIGANNASVNFDNATQFNLNWDRTQKFKDGTVKIVFDEIVKNNAEYIADNSACVFQAIRYGDTPVLRTFNATTTAGKAEVNMPVDDQTVNYYTIIVRCNDAQTNELVADYDRLVLIVGGDGNRQEPGIEL